MTKLLPVLAIMAFASVPIAIGVAEQKETQVEALSPAAARAASECLASEEVIKDIEQRENKLKKKEEALADKEKELAAQSAVIKEQLAKLEEKQTELQTVKQKQLAEREEKVNKLIETLELMSPKAAAGVVGGVDEDLAVMALSKLTSVKAGKILSNLKNDKSSRLSELLAYGRLSVGKEKANGESVERTPASK